MANVPSDQQRIANLEQELSEIKKMYDLHIHHLIGPTYTGKQIQPSTPEPADEGAPFDEWGYDQMRKKGKSCPHCNGSKYNLRTCPKCQPDPSVQTWTPNPT